MRTRTLVAGVVAVVAYGIASHALMLHAADRPWAVAVIVGPLLLALAAAAWRRRHLPSLLACVGATVAVGLLSLHGTLQDVRRVYVLQYVAIHLSLAAGFGLTLRRGSIALITRLASWVHSDFSPPMRAYTHRLTKLWVLYFCAMAVAGVVVYWLAGWAWWSLFANLLTPLAVATFFFGEHWLRYRLHPEFERVSVQRALQAYRRLSSREAPR
ncbi:MAG: hypothetical protein ABIR94_20350 [Rubrivivax sp.]